jgi:hypothetical protein
VPAPLDAIEEEFDEDEVQSEALSALSGAVSSSEGGDVGNLADLPCDHSSTGEATQQNAHQPFALSNRTNELQNDRIAELIKRVEAAELLNRTLKEDGDDREAAHLSKLDRMETQLSSLRFERHEHFDLVEAMKRAQDDDKVREVAEIAAETEKLRWLELEHHAAMEV